MSHATEPWREWVDRAVVDLRAADVLLANGGPEPIVCFLCQQAVEKLLKAVIEEAGRRPPRVHALSTLRHDALACRAQLPLPETDALQFYTATRYPQLLPLAVGAAEAARARAIAFACQMCFRSLRAMRRSSTTRRATGGVC